MNVQTEKLGVLNTNDYSVFTSILSNLTRVLSTLGTAE